MYCHSDKKSSEKAEKSENEQGVQDYFRHRATRLKHSPALVLDTTTMSTYSEQLHEAWQGFNKAHDGLPTTIKQLVIYSIEDCEPIAFYRSGSK